MNHLTRLLFIAPICFGIPVSAQITINSADMPSAGDTVRYQTTATTADMADTGPSHTWDFSGLVPGGEGADTMVTVGSTPLLYQFFFNNALIYPQHKADYAMRGASVGLQGFSLDNLFDYYKNNSSGFRNVGFGASLNSLPTSVQRNPVDWIYRFPMDYGNTDSSASHFDVSVPMLGYYGQDQMRRNEVDGWGTIILPTDTFQVLRVKSRIARTDTIHIDQFGFGFSIPEPETIEYKWIAQGMEEPVLQVTSIAGVNTVVRFYYHPDDISTTVATLKEREALWAWPNPASTVLHIKGAAIGPVQLLAADGSVVYAGVINSLSARTLDISALAPGLYTLRTGTDGATQRVVIAR